jgi:hypothetical protein
VRKITLFRTPILIIICGTQAATPIQLRGKADRTQSVNRNGGNGIMRKDAPIQSHCGQEKESEEKQAFY